MPRGEALRKWRAVLNKRRSGLISGEHYIPALFARHVPQARQMLRKLQDRHMVCEPIWDDYGRREATLSLYGDGDFRPSTDGYEGCQRWWWRARRFLRVPKRKVCGISSNHDRTDLVQSIHSPVLLHLANDGLERPSLTGCGKTIVVQQESTPAGCFICPTLKWDGTMGRRSRGRRPRS